MLELDEWEEEDRRPKRTKRKRENDGGLCWLTSTPGEVEGGPQSCSRTKRKFVARLGERREEGKRAGWAEEAAGKCSSRRGRRTTTLKVPSCSSYLPSLSEAETRLIK